MAPDPLPSGAQAHGDVRGASWLRCARCRTRLESEAGPVLPLPEPLRTTAMWADPYPAAPRAHVCDGKPTLVLARLQKGSVRRWLPEHQPSPSTSAARYRTRNPNVLCFPCYVLLTNQSCPTCRAFSRMFSSQSALPMPPATHMVHLTSCSHTHFLHLSSIILHSADSYLNRR